jgi:tRNA (mo5U34)-methyltransferase
MFKSQPSADLEGRVLAQKWFYKFELPSGKTTELYIPNDIELIHTTRRDMMLEALKPLDLANMTAIDFSSHQGYFSVELAKRCKYVLGLEFQERHVASAKLIAQALGLKNTEFIQEDLEKMPKGKHTPADIVINFGLMYNLENPIAVLRRSRELTKKVLLIETQTTILDLAGAVDSGNAANTNYMHGYFGLFAGNPQNIDGSASDIVFYPSRGGLIWVLEKLGFSRVEVLEPPAGAYQQIATGKRIMIAAWV